MQHPASAAEEAFYRQRVTFNAARRLEQLQSTSRRVSVRRAKELEVGAYFVRNRVEAAQKLQRYAEKAYLMSPRFNDPYPPLTNIGAPAAGGETPHHSNNNEAQPLVLQRARGPHPGASPSPRPSPRSPRKRTSARGKAGREEAALTSAQTVLAVMDVLYAKLEAEDIAAQRMRFGQGDEPPPTLAQVAKQYADSSAAKDSPLQTLAGVIIPNGLLGLRIGCAECDPHPTVHLFQRLMGWRGDVSEKNMKPSQLNSLWLLCLWLLPPRERLAKVVAQQRAQHKGETMRYGAAPKQEPMPPPTIVGYDAVRRCLSMINDKRLLEDNSQYRFLQRAARGLKESRRAARSASTPSKKSEGVIDVEELLLYWTEVWNDYRKELDASLDAIAAGTSSDELHSRRRVRVDHEPPPKKEIQLSDKQQAAQAVEIRRQAALAAVELEADIDVVTGEKLIGGNRAARNDGFGNENVSSDRPVLEVAEEDFAAGMRANAMEFDMVDADRDKQLDFDEYVVFIKQRERGPHSAHELRARFDALDQDGSGKIDLHEFIRFSLRDALARDSARVIDLLREWDGDKNGVIDRKEFCKAIQALGFGALADKQDIDLVFDEFDVSKDGLVDFNELNKQLRQSAAVDAKMLGVHGSVALRSEQDAQLKRTGAGRVRKGVGNVASGLDASKAARAAEVLDMLRNLFSSSPEKMMELFREIDESGDGLVSRQEFALACRALSLSLPKKELKMLFQTLDPDGSGSIEYHEMRGALGIKTDVQTDVQTDVTVSSFEVSL